MPPREPRELAELLLRKAAADVDVVRKMIDSGVPYEAVGFHAQQACEKAMKAVLVAVGTRYPHSHNLGLLVDLVRNSGLVVPEHVEDAVDLTPFAVLYRYDDYTLDEDPVPVAGIVDLVSGVHAWAEATVHPPREA